MVEIHLHKHTHIHTLSLSILFSLSIRYHWRRSREPSLALWTFSPCTPGPSTICSVHLQNTRPPLTTLINHECFYRSAYILVVVLLRYVFFLFFPLHEFLSFLFIFGSLRFIFEKTWKLNQSGAHRLMQPWLVKRKSIKQIT